MNFPRLLSLILTISLVAWSVAAYASLPAEIPTHFGLDGTPDAWSEKSLLAWFGIVVIALGTVALVQGISIFLPGHPGWVNMPAKAQFLELSPEDRAPVITEMQRMLDWITVEVILIFSLIQVGAWITARGGDGSMMIVAVLVVSPLFLVVMALSMGRIQRLIRNAT